MTVDQRFFIDSHANVWAGGHGNRADDPGSG